MDYHGPHRRRPAGVSRVYQRLGRPLRRRRISAGQGVRRHRSARLSPRAEGRFQVLGPPGPVRSARCVELREPKLPGRDHESQRREDSQEDVQIRRFGGIAGEIELASDATLGVYQLRIIDPAARGWIGGGGSFRVEEYKKPEFEVTVDAPTRPVMLGEKITATLKARYYFARGDSRESEVQSAASDYSETWYPWARWDWLYGRGYWWFASDYYWYPGWSEWGCRAPVAIWWWGWRQPQQPELVAERETTIGPDGLLKIEIDTGPAKEIHGDRDHQYQITAEVTDQSRRTIVGTGSVLVAREPFKVFSWVDRGFYRIGDTIEASFHAQTLDQKPVQGKGKLRLADHL